MSDGYNLYGFAIKDIENTKELDTNSELYACISKLLRDLLNMKGIVILPCGDYDWYWYGVPVKKMGEHPELKEKIDYIVSVLEKYVPSLFETFDWLPLECRINRGYVTIPIEEIDIN